MKKPKVKLKRSGSLYRQIYETLRGWILSGRYRAGERLPSTRVLANDLSVSRNTVLLAYEQLVAEGYCVGNIGSGTFVNASVEQSPLESGSIPGIAESRIAKTPKLSIYGTRLAEAPSESFTSTRIRRINLRYDFQYGLPSVREFPHEIWQRLVNRKIRTSSMNSLRYGPAQGHPLLRNAISEYLRRARGLNCSPEQIVIVNGSQQALDLASRILLNSGDRVVIEDPSYQGARQIFTASGARLIPAKVDEDGLNAAALPRTARGAKIIYVTPSHQFPSGAMMPAARRLALLTWARENEAYILEDDYDGEYRYDGWPIAAIQSLDQAESVLYVGTFSKSLFPSIRIGYLILPNSLVSHFVKAKWLADRQTSTLEQEVLADFIAEGHFERHLRRSRMRYANRRKVLLATLEESLGNHAQVSGTSAGIHVVVWLRNFTPARLDKLIERAADAGVGLYSLSPYYLQPPQDRAGLLFGYASLTEDAIRSGIRAFASVL